MLPREGTASLSALIYTACAELEHFLEITPYLSSK